MWGDKDSPVAKALRKAGFIPLPRLWVKPTDMSKIHEIAEKHREVVNTIRGQIKDDVSVHQDQALTADPVDDKEAAWAAYEKMRNQG